MIRKHRLLTDTLGCYTSFTEKITTGIASAGASAGMTKMAVFANVGAGEGGGVT